VRLKSPQVSQRAQILATAGLLDQMVSAGLNFGALVVAAQRLDIEDFGRASVAAAIFAAILVLGRALIGELLLVDGGDDEAGRLAFAVSAALIVGLFVALLAFAASLTLSGTMRWLVLIVGFSSPGFLLQDGLRYVSFRESRHWEALRTDVVWSAIVFVGFSAAPATTLEDVLNPISVWLGSASIAAALELAYRSRGGLPRVFGRPTLWRNSSLVKAYLGDATVAVATSHALLAILAVVASFEVVGAVRGVFLIFGPITVLFSAAYVLLMPRLLDLFSKGDDLTIRKTEWATSLCFASVAPLIWLALIVQPALGRRLLDGVWPSVMPLVGWGCLAFSMLVLGSGPMIVLRAQQRQIEVAKIRAVIAPIQLTLAILGAYYFQSRGLLIGQAIAFMLATTAYWWRRRGRKFGSLSPE